MSTTNHPPHYNFGKYEVIEVIEDWKLGFHLGNAVKYISRCGKKGIGTEGEDIRKAIWYLERYLQLEKPIQPPPSEEFEDERQ